MKKSFFVSLFLAFIFSFVLSCANHPNKINVSQDPEVHIASVDFAIMGDAGLWNKNTEQLKKSMNEYKIKNLIMPGDNLYQGTYEQAWKPWTDDQFKFDIVAIGNHNKSYKSEIQFFNMPNEYFSKTYLNNQIQFLVLNSDNKKNVDEQMRWLEKELQSTTAKQVYLVYHHPSLNVARHLWTEKKEFQIKLRSLIKKYRSKITAAIVGHDHIAGLIHFDDFPVIISGCSQNPRIEKQINNIQEGITVKTEFMFDQIPYWVKMNSHENYSDLIYIRGSDNSELCTVRLETNKKATYNCKSL